MNILFLGGFPYPEQPQKNVFNFRGVSGLIQKEIKVTVVCIRMWLPGRKIVHRSSYQGIPVIYLCIPHYPFKNEKLYYFSLKIIDWFGRILLKKEITSVDLIHSAGGDYYGVLGGWWAKTFKKKHLCQLIGSDINSVLPRLVHFKPFRSFEKRIHFLTANSKALLKQFNTVFSGTVPSRSVYRGVNLGQFKLNVNKHKSNNIQFYYLGGYSNYPDLPFGVNTKGGLTLLTAWKKNETLFKSQNVFLNIGGPDARDNPIILAWLQTLKYPEQVKTIGLIPPKNITEHYAKADVIIIPSMEEGLPNVSVEAGASGCAVIGTRVGGIPEVIIHNETGLIVEPGDENSLTEAMLTLAKNTTLIRSMGTKARQRMEQYFNANNFTEEYIKIYHQCVE